MKKLTVISLTFFLLMITSACSLFTDDDVPVQDYETREEWGRGVPLPMYDTFDDITIDERSTRIKQYWSDLENTTINYAVNVIDYGAEPDTSEDATQAINDAIVAARSQFDGGVVFLPAGEYTIRGNIVMDPNVTLRGEWLPPSEDTIAEGTVLNVYSGRGQDSSAKPLIETADSSLISNLTIYYPSQFVDDPLSYPFAIENQGYFGVEIQNVTLINAYNGIKIDTNNWLFFRNIYMTSLNTGFYNHGIYDIGKWDNVNISADYWGMYERAIEKEAPVTDDDVKALTLAEARGVVVGRYDWIYMYDTHISDMHKGIDVQGAFNGILYDVSITDSIYPLNVSYMSGIGTQITNSHFSAITEDGIAANFSAGVNEDGEDISYRAYTMFNDVTLESEGTALYMDTPGMISLQHSSLISSHDTQYEASIENGVFVADQNSFSRDANNIYLGDKVTVAKITGHGPIDITDDSNDRAMIDIVEDTHALSTSKVEVDFHTDHAYDFYGDDMFYAPDYGVSTRNDDNTKNLQYALMDAYDNGGGTVVVPGGEFIFRGRIVIPPNVKLKGINEVAMHWGGQEQGTTLVSYYGKDQVDGPAFIALSDQAAVEGFSIFYPEQSWTDHQEYAVSIHMTGEETYLKNVTVVNAYNGIKITGNDFVIDYGRGKSLKDFYIIDGVDTGYLMNSLITIGDWQDARVSDGPGPEAWKEHPNMEGNRAFVIRDSDNIELINNFAFGFDRGVELEGEVNNLLSYGTGIDAARNSVILHNSGTGNVFMNSELVTVENYIWTTEDHSGEVDFINTNSWMSNVGDLTIDGTGTVRIQQYKQMTGEVFLDGGTIVLENAILHSSKAKLTVSDDVTSGLIMNPIGNSTFLEVINDNDNVDIVHPSRGK